MNEKIYNDYLMDLFKDSTFAMLAGEKGVIENSRVNLKKVTELFEAGASVFNNSLALEFVMNLNEKNSSLSDKLRSYPDIFWKTPEAQEHANLGLRNFEKETFNIIEELVHKNSDLFVVGNHKFNPQEITQIRESQISEQIKKFTLEIVNAYEKLGPITKFSHSLTGLESNYRAMLKHENLDLDPDVINKTVAKVLESKNPELFGEYLSSHKLLVDSMKEHPTHFKMR